MSYSSERKQALVGWAFQNGGFFSPAQLQKFLLFYEMFSKVDGDSYELDGLKGYKNEPVFSAVLGDINYEKDFISACIKQFQSRAYSVNVRRAKLSDFLVRCLGDKLSEFVRKLNIWAAKQMEMEQSSSPVPLSEEDFSENDAAILRDIETAYSENYIDSVKTFSTNGKTFVYFKSDEHRLTEEIYNVLRKAAFDPDLDSPVYISFSETGELLFDV